MKFKLGDIVKITESRLENERSHGEENEGINFYQIIRKLSYEKYQEMQSRDENYKNSIRSADWSYDDIYRMKNLETSKIYSYHKKFLEYDVEMSRNKKIEKILKK